MGRFSMPFSYRNSGLESKTDLTLSYRMNGMKNSSIVALQVKNIIGKQYMGENYNIAEHKIEDDFFTSPVPFLSYKIEF